MADTQELLKQKKELQDKLQAVNNALEENRLSIQADIATIFNQGDFGIFYDPESLQKGFNVIIVRSNDYSFDTDDWGNIQMLGVLIVFFIDEHGMCTAYKRGSEVSSWNLGKPEKCREYLDNHKFDAKRNEEIIPLIQRSLCEVFNHNNNGTVNRIEQDFSLQLGHVHSQFN